MHQSCNKVPRALIFRAHSRKYNDCAQKGPGDTQRRSSSERSTTTTAAAATMVVQSSQGEEGLITVITACKIVPVFRRAIDTMQASCLLRSFRSLPPSHPPRPLPSPSHPLYMHESANFFRGRTPAGKTEQIVGYTYSFRRIFRRSDIEKNQSAEEEEQCGGTRRKTAEKKSSCLRYDRLLAIMLAVCARKSLIHLEHM